MAVEVGAAIAVGVVAAALGGAGGGAWIGGKDLGYGLAAMMGSTFGVSIGAIGVVVGSLGSLVVAAVR